MEENLAGFIFRLRGNSFVFVLFVTSFYECRGEFAYTTILYTPSMKALSVFFILVLFSRV